MNAQSSETAYENIIINDNNKFTCGKNTSYKARPAVDTLR